MRRLDHIVEEHRAGGFIRQKKTDSKEMNWKNKNHVRTCTGSEDTIKSPLTAERITMRPEIGVNCHGAG